MGRTDQAAVEKFAGLPDATRDGREPGNFPYRALGYDCGSRKDAVRLARGGPACTTAFFLDRASGKLETFFTSSPAYTEGHGVRIGMKQAEAERLLHRRLTVGCTTALYFASPTGSLSVDFAGGAAHGTAIKGARVEAFVVHGHDRDAAIFDCL